MADEGKQDWIYGTVLVLLMLIVGFNLILDYGRGVDIRYVSFFISIIGFGILAAIVLAVVSLGLDGDGYKPNLVDSSDVRMLAGVPWSRTAAAVLLFIIFFGGGLATQSSIIPIVNPYDSSTLIAKGSTLSTEHNQYATALRSGVYPGVGEDVAGFLLTSITTLLLLLFFQRFDEEARSDKLLFLLAAIVSCVLWGFIFASAHALAYGSNAPAFVFAWLYGSSTQFVNQIVGAPVSILAHIAHNFVIVASLSVAVCVGTVCSGFLFLPRGLFMKARKGQAVLWAVLIVGIAMVLGFFVFLGMHGGGGKLASIATPSCTDFQPAGASCSTDQDCVGKLVPAGENLSDNVQLRCNAGACEMRVLQCGVIPQ